MSMLLRMIWMMAGGVVLIFCLFNIVKGRERFFTPADVVYWATAAVMVAARFADVRHYHGATTSGEPATMRDAAQYAVFVAVAGGTLWGLAHIVSTLGWM